MKKTTEATEKSAYEGVAYKGLKQWRKQRTSYTGSPPKENEPPLKQLMQLLYVASTVLGARKHVIVPLYHRQ